MGSFRNDVDVIKEYLARDPSIPRQNPTQSYWQHVPHRLANVKSSTLVEAADIAIIGSGITGASVAKTLLDESTSPVVVVLEARSLCSGATGRNGGQLATNAGEIYSEYKNNFGSNMAGKICQFSFRTCERMKEIIAEYAPEESEYRDVTKVRAFLDQKSLAAMKESIAAMEAEHPSLRGIYKVIDSETVRKDHGVHGAKGGVTLPAGVMWSYRVVTKVFEGLLAKYPERLRIETNTPVTSVRSFDGSYIVNTPRGSIWARHVVHCTNGYASHLLPGLRGLLIPLRGTMTVQDLGPNVPRDRAKDSYGFHYTPAFDEKDDTLLADGLVYLTQNAKSGFYFIGGEKGRIEESLTADDTATSQTSVNFLQQSLLQYFNYKDVRKDSLVSAWSGIMGVTMDSAPYVGRLPTSATGRSGEGEWIAAGFNGYGMPYCWLAGEAVAKFVLGQGQMDWFPEAFSVNEDRLSPTRVLSMAKAMAEMGQMQ